MSRVDRPLKVYCKTVTALLNRNTLFSFFQKNQNNFCRLKPAQQLSTDMPLKHFIFIFKPVQYVMPPSSPQKKREVYPQSLSWYSFHSMRTSVKLIFVNAAESLASCRALGAHTDRAKANEIIWVVSVCSSATMLTTCMLCVLCSAHYKLSKKEKVCKWKCFVHHRISFLLALDLSRSKVWPVFISLYCCRGTTLSVSHTYI